MKQLKIKEVSAILKKYVSTSETRPVLQNANVLEENIVATNSHHMVRINKSIIENEFFTNETNLFDPKISTYTTSESNYPPVDRLFPDSSNTELTITVDNIKRSVDVIKYLQHISGAKKGTILNITTYENELVFGYYVDGERSGFYTTGINCDDEISFAVNGEYLKSMFTSFKKVLKTIGEKEFTMKFISNMRPILFETANKELEILVLPVRTYVNSNNITIAENQDVTIEKVSKIKAMIKKVIMFGSGIVRKKVVEHEQINDFMTYLLKEDVTSVENTHNEEIPQNAYDHLNLFVEIDGHLFTVCSVKYKEKLKLYTKDELMKMIKDNYNKAKEEGKQLSAGLTEYFDMVNELEVTEDDITENQYNSEPEIEQGKNEGYLQHFASDTLEIEKEEENMATIQLQGVGEVDAIPASEVKEGDVRLYNYYGTGTVIKVIEKSPKILTFITEENGNYYMFDVRKTSLIAIYKRDQDISMHRPTHASHRKNGLVDVSEYFQTEQIEEEKTEAYHLELQERGMTFTETKPVINKSATYKVIVSKDRENNLIGEFEKVLTGEEVEFQLFMNEVLEIIKEIQPAAKTTDELKQELNVIDNKLNKGVPGEELDELKRYSGELRVNISKSLDQLFHNDTITGAQNARINMLLNEWINKDKYTFVALYKELNNSDQICLHVTTDNSNLFVWFDIHGVRVYSNSFIDKIQNKLKLIHDFSYNRNVSSEHGNIEVSPAGENDITEKLSDHEIVLNHNEDRQSIELYFDGVPSEEVRNAMKAQGFRYAFKEKKWYKKNFSEQHIKFVHTLGNVAQESYNRNSDESRANYEEIELTPIENYIVPESISNREYEANWIFRQGKTDHTKELQSYLLEYQKQVLEVVSGTDNKKVIYDLKRSLEYFKKHYSETYVKWLSIKGDNVGWAVSGRGNYNYSRAQKLNNRQENQLHRLSELQEEMKKRIQKAKNQIAKEENLLTTAAIESSGLNIEFKMKTKEFTYMNVKEKRKVHTYNEYWIAKIAGCFRVFKNDQEIHSCKTAETLEHAKKFVVYHIQQEQIKNAI